MTNARYVCGGLDASPEGCLALLNETMLHGIKQLQGLRCGAIPPGARPPLFPAQHTRPDGT